MMAQLTALQARLAQVEVERSLVSLDGYRAPSGRLQEAYLAARAERDELAVLLAQIEAYQPGITAKARAWVEQIEKN